LVALPLVAFACATGSTPLSSDDLFGDAGGDLDASSPVDSPYQTYDDTGTSSGGDTGTPQPSDSGSTAKKDSGTTTPDSGTNPQPDSGPAPGSGDCVGQQSSQLTMSYDQACDNYFSHDFFGFGNPCTPGANQCAALNNSKYTFCCYTPAPQSNCDFDYGEPQCLPK
jgi:hypothetical protein